MIAMTTKPYTNTVKPDESIIVTPAFQQNAKPPSGFGSLIPDTYEPFDPDATEGATWGTNINNEPTDLADVNAAEGAKLTGVEAGADVTASNTANDTTNVNSVASSQMQPRAESLWENDNFIGAPNDGFTEEVGGGGSITRTIASTTCVTGASSNTVDLHSASSSSPYDYDLDHEFVCRAQFSAVGSNVSALLGSTTTLTPSVNTSGTCTDRHIGFTIGTSTVYASNSDNSSQTKTDVTAGITLTDQNRFSYVWDAGTDVKFYINNVLVATHTTNLPSANSVRLIFQLTYSAGGASKTLTLGNGYFLTFTT